MIQLRHQQKRRTERNILPVCLCDIAVAVPFRTSCILPRPITIYFIPSRPYLFPKTLVVIRTTFTRINSSSETAQSVNRAPYPEQLFHTKRYREGYAVMHITNQEYVHNASSQHLHCQQCRKLNLGFLGQNMLRSVPKGARQLYVESELGGRMQ